MTACAVREGRTGVSVDTGAGALEREMTPGPGPEGEAGVAT